MTYVVEVVEIVIPQSQSLEPEVPNSPNNTSFDISDVDVVEEVGEDGGEDSYSLEDDSVDRGDDDLSKFPTPRSVVIGCGGCA